MGKGFKMRSKTVWPRVSTKPLPRHITKVGRNDPCPCGSGKKYKVCHEKEGSDYLLKLAKVEDAKLLKATRLQLKKKGMPWYRRLFIRL